jgi:hypothetical protein
MARDPLVALSRLRGIALDAARRALAARLGEQDAAAMRSADLAATRTRELAAQAGHPENALLSDYYAAWLKHSQAARQAAQAALGTAAQASAAARVTVNEERTALRALEAAMAQAREQRRQEADRQEQRALDEAAGSRARRQRWSG